MKIREDFEKAQGLLKTARKEVRTDYGEEGEGSDVVIYRTPNKEGSILSVKVESAFGHNGIVTEYFYREGLDPYFIFERHSKSGAANSSWFERHEMRIYIHKGRILRCWERSAENSDPIEKKKHGDCKDRKAAEESLKEAKALIAFAKTRPKKSK